MSEIHALSKAGVLTQVVFVHDYIQLVFENATLSLYGVLELQADSKITHQSDELFPSQLVRQIGTKVTYAKLDVDDRLLVRFDEAIYLIVARGSGPESWEFASDDTIIVS